MTTIPTEIEDALSQDYGYVLLIKGRAGTGKTTIALEILRKLKNPIYISTRIDPPLLLKQFPWISENISKESIIDATLFDFTRHASLTDEIFLQSFNIYNLPDFVKIMLSKMKHESGTIVIDSWDVIQILGETRWEQSKSILANYIIDLARKKNYNLILIVESEKDTFLDYLVDGIISLTEEVINDNQRFRHLNLIKLRGICINQTSYLCTLFNGRFSTFIPSELIPILTLKAPPIIQDNIPKISTGIPDFDKLLFGGVETGGVYLFEVDSKIRGQFLGFTLNMVFNFLLQSRGVIALPPPERKLESDLQIIKKLLNNDQIFNNFFRIIEFGKMKPTLPPYILRVIPKDDADYFSQIKDVTAQLLKMDAKSPVLILLNLNNVIFSFDYNEIRRDTPRIFTQIKRSGNILLITGITGDPFIPELERVVDAHFLIKLVDHQITLYGKSPFIGVHAVKYDNSQGYLQINLIPIV